MGYVYCSARFIFVSNMSFADCHALPHTGREEFDKILGDYDGVADVPCICFIEELVAAYPDAKVVVTSREVEGWLRSMASTAGRCLGWKLWPTLASWDQALAGPFWKHAETVMPIQFRTITDFSSPNTPARQAFKDHYERVRKAVPRDRMLEYQVQEGWEPLCKFLEVEVPGEEFPRINDAKQFIFVHSMMWWLAFGKMIGKIGLMVAVPAAAVGGAWYWQNMR